MLCGRLIPASCNLQRYAMLVGSPYLYKNAIRCVIVDVSLTFILCIIYLLDTIRHEGSRVYDMNLALGSLGKLRVYILSGIAFYLSHKQA